MISKRARYALHGVGYLAYRSGEGAPVPFADILAYLRDYSRRLSLSPGYISKLFQELSRAGLVQASVGRKGGYALARDPERVSIAEVVAAVDGWPVEQCCLLSMGSCNNQDACGVFEVVNAAQTAFFDLLAGETAATLAQKMFRSRPPVGARASGPAPRLDDDPS
jgi:Rrf2 family protein